MTRKDYIAFAAELQAIHQQAKYPERVVKEARLNLEPRQVEIIAERLCYVMENDNPRFDRAHFMAVVRAEKASTSRPPRK